MARYVWDVETDGFLEEMTVVHCLVLYDLDTDELISCADRPGYLPISHGLQLLADADEIIGHNIVGFDLPALKKLYPKWKTRAVVTDTLLVARVVWPDVKQSDFEKAKKGLFPSNLIGRYSLEAFGHRLGLHKGDFKGPWEVWTPAMHSYCEQDVRVNVRLLRKAEKRIEEVQDPRGGPLARDFLELEHSVARIIRRQESFGFRFDKGAAQQLYSTLLARRYELEQELRTLFPPWLRGREIKTSKRTVTYRKGYVAPCVIAEGSVYQKLELVEFNPASRDHISDRLMMCRGWAPQAFGKDGKPTVDDEVLAALPYPEAKQLSEYLLVQKRIGALAEGKEAWLNHERNGRIHGGVITNGAVTGRMTHNRPNLAQVPAARSPYGPECRALFIADVGYVLVGCDADALELRCLAGYLAPIDGGAYIETVLRGDKAQGTDMHSVNCRALGMDPKVKYQVGPQLLPGRDIAKTWFYAWAYGSGDENLGHLLGVFGDPNNPAHWAARRDGSKVDKHAALAGAKARKKFLKALPAIGTLIDRIKARVEGRGFLMGLDRRPLPCRSAHSALNTLLQSAGAILMKRALVILDDALQAAGLVPGQDYEFVANVHDEWQLQVLEKHSEFVGKTAAEAIRLAGEYYDFRCPLAGDFSIGKNWYETH